MKQTKAPEIIPIAILLVIAALQYGAGRRPGRHCKPPQVTQAPPQGSVVEHRPEKPPKEERVHFRMRHR